MLIDDAEAALRTRLTALGDDASVDLGASFSAMIDWYASVRADDAAPLDEDGDMLLFQWGEHDWGAGPAFEVDLTRQLIRADDPEDEDIIQVSLRFRFPVDGRPADLGSGSRWCTRPSELAGFRREVEGHPAAVFGRSRAPMEVVLSSEVAG